MAGGETAVGETTDSSSSKTLTSLPGTDAICGREIDSVFFYVLIHIAEWLHGWKPIQLTKPQQFSICLTQT